MASDVAPILADPGTHLPGHRGASLARGLGWFSLALGALEVAAPGVLERVVGVRSRSRLILPAIGVREIISGIGILRARRPLPLWLWTRVAGDLADLGLLLLTMRQESLSRRSRHDESGDDAPAEHLTEPPPRTVTVDRPLDACRRFWKAFSESPRFQRDLATLRSVQMEAGRNGHGTVIRLCMPSASTEVERRAQAALRVFKQVVEHDGQSAAAGPTRIP